jgi:hypothetical protein
VQPGPQGVEVRTLRRAVRQLDQHLRRTARGAFPAEIADTG